MPNHLIFFFLLFSCSVWFYSPKRGNFHIPSSIHSLPASVFPTPTGTMLKIPQSRFLSLFFFSRWVYQVKIFEKIIVSHPIKQPFCQCRKIWLALAHSYTRLGQIYGGLQVRAPSPPATTEQSLATEKDFRFYPSPVSAPPEGRLTSRVCLIF